MLRLIFQFELTITIFSFKNYLLEVLDSLFVLFLIYIKDFLPIGISKQLIIPADTIKMTKFRYKLMNTLKLSHNF